jgi:hypothetical protein
MMKCREFTNFNYNNRCKFIVAGILFCHIAVKAPVIHLFIFIFAMTYKDQII